MVKCVPVGKYPYYVQIIPEAADPETADAGTDGEANWDGFAKALGFRRTGTSATTNMLCNRKNNPGG